MNKSCQTGTLVTHVGFWPHLTSIESNMPKVQRPLPVAKNNYTHIMHTIWYYIIWYNIIWYYIIIYNITHRPRVLPKPRIALITRIFCSPPLNFYIHSKFFNKGLILPPPLNSYIRWRSSIRVKFPTPVKLFHSLKIFNKGLILPTPSNSYIHWRSSMRV